MQFLRSYSFIINLKSIIYRMNYTNISLWKLEAARKIASLAEKVLGLLTAAR